MMHKVNNYSVLALVLLMATTHAGRDASLTTFSKKNAPAKKSPAAKKVVKKPLAVVQDSKITVPADAQEIDKVLVVLYLEDGVAIITQSDVNRMGLDGSPRTLDELVIEQLMYADAKKYKMVPTDEALDKHLLAVQRDNNLTRKQLETIFEQAGYKTYEEGRTQFGVTYAVQSILDFKVRSRLSSVPEKEVRAYCDAHPEKQEAAFEVARAFVSEDQFASRKALEMAVAQHIKNAAPLAAEWSEPFWIEKAQLAADKGFFDTMKVGDVEIVTVDGGYELFRMHNKKEEKLLTYEERAADVMAKMRGERGQKLFNDYKQSLFDATAIVYF